MTGALAREQYPAAAQSWLTVILCERFGPGFVIESSPGMLSIRREDAEGRIELQSDVGVFTQPGADLACAHWDAEREGWTSALSAPLPAPGARELAKPLIERADGLFRIRYDVLGLIFWALARVEELGRRDLDAFGRFPSSASHAAAHGYLERPIVDEWLHILGQVMRLQWPGFAFTQHRSSMKLSHDVDQPSRYAFGSAAAFLRKVAGDVLRRRDYAGAVLAPSMRLGSRSAISGRDPNNTFDWLMDLSDRHGLVSAFYFICGRTDAGRDADYEIEHPAMRALLRKIHARGHEIGLHPSFGTYQQPQLIVAEAARLRAVCQEEGITQDVWGGRMHYLRWEHPRTLYGWEAAEFSYDSTLSYADAAGFRCGTCFEYPAYDANANRSLNVRIRPLVAMEATIIEPYYMGLGLGEPAVHKLRQLRNTCEAVQGCFTLLWHNSTLDSESAKQTYEAVLR
ncbi:hypothetical protein D3C85_1018350 [compost metagenome]